jgi:hypothetical protein
VFNDGHLKVVCDMEFLNPWVLFFCLRSSKKLCRAPIGESVVLGEWGK